MSTTVNELNALAEQVTSGISLMYATTARISEDVSSAALASFIREQRDRYELLQPIDQLVDAYYDAQETVYDIYHGVCKDIRELTDAVINGDDSSRDAVSQFERRNKAVFTKLGRELSETEYRRLVVALGYAIGGYEYAMRTSYIAKALSPVYQDLLSHGAGSAQYLDECERLDAVLDKFVDTARAIVGADAS